MSRGRRISLTLAGLVVIFCLLEGLFRSSGETVHVIGIERLRPEILGRELDHDGDGTIAQHDGRTETNVVGDRSSREPEIVKIEKLSAAPQFRLGQRNELGRVVHLEGLGV